MLISSARAAHFAPASESSGGAIALSIILAVGIAIFLANMAYKKWRARKPSGDDGDE